MPEYTLTYFNFRGFGESIRYILSYIGADFEDNRVSMSDWPALKGTLPFKQLPILEENGKTLNQSSAICRYLGRKHDLEHEDPWTRAQLEALVDSVKDAFPKIRAYFISKSPEAKSEVADTIAELFSKLEPMASGGYFYGSTTPTWVDLYFAGSCDTVESLLADALAPFPNLTALVQNIRGNSGVSKYLKNKPDMLIFLEK